MEVAQRLSLLTLLTLFTMLTLLTLLALLKLLTSNSRSNITTNVEAQQQN